MFVTHITQKMKIMHLIGENWVPTCCLLLVAHATYGGFKKIVHSLRRKLSAHTKERSKSWDVICFAITVKSACSQFVHNILGGFNNWDRAHFEVLNKLNLFTILWVKICAQYTAQYVHNILGENLVRTLETKASSWDDGRPSDHFHILLGDFIIIIVELDYRLSLSHNYYHFYIILSLSTYWYEMDHFHILLCDFIIIIVHLTTLSLLSWINFTFTSIAFFVFNFLGWITFTRSFLGDIIINYHCPTLWSHPPTFPDSESLLDRLRRATFKILSPLLPSENFTPRDAHCFRY